MSLAAPLVWLRRTEVVRRINPCRIFARHNTRPRGTAHRTRGIRIREPQSTRRQLVNIRRVIKAAAITPQVGPTKVIDKNEDKVRRTLLRDRGNGEQENEDSLKDRRIFHARRIALNIG